MRKRNDGEKKAVDKSEEEKETQSARLQGTELPFTRLQLAVRWMTHQVVERIRQSREKERERDEKERDEKIRELM